MPRLYQPEPGDESPTRLYTVRGAQLALSLVALSGIGVSIFSMMGADEPMMVQRLARQRAVTFSSGLLYLLAAALLHLKTFFALGRTPPLSQRAARLMLASHGLVAAAVVYSFAIQRLTSRALLVGLDSLLSSTAILSMLACVVALALTTQLRMERRSETRAGLLRAVLFVGVCILLAGSLFWLEFSPLP
ncbi:MAG: hypothetical protein MI757_19630 [Pirellulales bacterium]|nr:hypothetical protein [Pirellulales bacterium]